MSEKDTETFSPVFLPEQSIFEGRSLAFFVILEPQINKQH